MTTKLCIKCEEDLPIDMFEITKGKNKEYYRNKCKGCRLIETQQQRNKRKEMKKEIITHKVCVECSSNLEISEFNKKTLSKDGYDKVCRKCYKSIRHKTKQNIIVKSEIIYCTKCKLTKPNTDFRTNARSSTGYFKTCNSCWKPKEWNKNKQKQSEAKYVKNNPQKIKEKNKRQAKMPQRQIKSRIQKRIRCALESINQNKNNKTTEYVGCDISYLKKWLEFQFNDDINWNNMNEWHIDHVSPCRIFDLTNVNQQKECFNWQNLRPCLAKENLEKSDKIIQSLIDSHKIIVSKFLEINPLPTQPGNRVEGTA